MKRRGLGAADGPGHTGRLCRLTDLPPGGIQADDGPHLDVEREGGEHPDGEGKVLVAPCGGDGDGWPASQLDPDGHHCLGALPNTTPARRGTHISVACKSPGICPRVLPIPLNLGKWISAQ